MFRYSKPAPFARVASLLKEMPWLWAIKQDWHESNRVEVMVAQDDYLDWRVAQYPYLLFVSFCYIHTVSEWSEEVFKVELTDADHHTWLDVLHHLRAQAINLDEVKHIISLTEDGIRVDRAPKDQSFADMFRYRLSTESVGMTV